ncbi:MAG: DUF4340 domain-containing protein [Bryobacterales bacterium]|nr:DUF4340 domain-containing protein [Bryobacterales bacterium]
MQFRGMLLALVVLVVLGGGIYLSNRHKQNEEKKGSSESPKIVSIPEDQIQQIEIHHRDGKDVVLKKGEKWQITAPEALPADQEAAGAVASALATVNSDRLVEENATDLSAFGLKDPQLQVIVTKKDGRKVTLDIGDETATSSGYFVRLGGENKVYTAGSFLKTSLDKSAQDLRDRRLVTFDSEKLSRVELSAKGQTLEFGKNSQNEWQLVKPKPLRADNWAVEELVRKVKDAKMETGISEEDAKKAAASYASGTKVAVVKLTDASGTHDLEVHKKDKDYYAKGSAIAGVYKAPNDLGEGLDKGLDDFRNKKLFDFGFNDPTKLEVRNASGESKVYQKSGEKWTLGGQQMDSVSIQSFIDKLRDLSAAKFTDTGYTKPEFDVRVTAKDGKIVDHVLISKNSNNYFAIRENEPSVYELDPKAVDDLEKAAADIKAPAPAKKDEKKK